MVGSGVGDLSSVARHTYGVDGNKACLRDLAISSRLLALLAIQQALVFPSDRRRVSAIGSPQGAIITKNIYLSCGAILQEHPFRLNDWHRFLFGNASWHFLLEVFLRTGVTYVLLVVAMRLLGRRVAAQYTLFEISIVVTLAAAIGVPLQAANRGMLPPFIIALVAVGLQRLLARTGATNRRFETFISTDVSLLVRDGQFEFAELARAAMPREKIYEALRLRGLQHLGQVSRLYMEPSGAFSVTLARAPRPGLSALPSFDDELRDEAHPPGWYACLNCGHVLQTEVQPKERCAVCAATRWTGAAQELGQ
jgi:uncharacterized membrane protein YcaP (DUF421 family)